MSMSVSQFTMENWKLVKGGPRRYRLGIPFNTYGIASVTVWEQIEAPDPDELGLQVAEVDIAMSKRQVILESTYKFDGEVRIGM